jgi:hypothetical protein
MMVNKSTNTMIILEGGAWPREARRVFELAAMQHVQLDPETVETCDVHDLQRMASQLQEHKVSPVWRRWHLN